MVKAVISGYYGFKNFGDESILSVLCNHLKSLNVDVTVLSCDTEYTSASNLVKAINRFDIFNVIGTIKECDVLISGGGSLLQDVTSFNSLIYYSFIIALGIIFNKKVIIFAQGIGPLRKNISKLLVKNLLKHCSYISVRDEKSQELLNEWNITSDLVCDPVYSIDISSGRGFGTVGVQLRDFSSMNYNLLQKLAQLICAKFSDKRIEVYSLQHKVDFSVCSKFVSLVKNIKPDIDINIVSEDIINKISHLEYFIGMRYHSLLVALKAGVKTCAINYDIKVDKIASEYNIPKISMTADENFEKIYQELLALDTEKIYNLANSKKFNWTEFDKVL